MESNVWCLSRDTKPEIIALYLSLSILIEKNTHEEEGDLYKDAVEVS